MQMMILLLLRLVLRIMLGCGLAEVARLDQA